jgi:rhodanese-related sulfurtransferase
MTRTHRMLALCAVILGFGAALVDARPPIAAADLAADIESQRDHISAFDLAERIVNGDPALRLLDLRPADEYARFHIPGAVHTTLDELARARYPRDSTIVLYSEGSAHAAQGWMLLRLRGYQRTFFLREGIYEWIARVHEPRLAVDATPAEREAFERGARFSRYFGGMPQAAVQRSDVPAGYWTTGSDRPAQPSRAAGAIAAIRRRGC